MRILILALMLTGCSDKTPAPGSSDLGVSADLAPTCSSTPTTSVELLNACTTADSVDKLPFYPTLAPNGQLPTLP